MSVTLERAPEPVRTRPVRSSRPAWIAVACVPVGIAAAIGLLLGPFHFLGEREVSSWEAFYSIASTALVLFLAPVVGVVLGARAWLSGNRLAAVAAGVALVAIAALVAVVVGAGWFDTTPSVTNGLGAVASVLGAWH